MTETGMVKAFAEAFTILGDSTMAWGQFEFELDRQFPENPFKVDGGFGRQVAIFMRVPYGVEERAAKVVQAAHDAVKAAKEARARYG